MAPRWPLVVLSAIAAAVYKAGHNYHDPLGPRHAGGPEGEHHGRRELPATGLRIVTFNIEYAIKVDEAIGLLTSHEGLRDADIVLLQEMDEPATKRIANALGMWYVYYPANFRSASGRDFGNAVLSRWPILEDAKVPLPHRSWYADNQRIATAVTLDIAGRRVRVYSTHLGTPMDIGTAARAEQLSALLDDAEKHELVIIGGDMNSSAVGRIAEESGYAWPTREGPWTTILGRWDHIFLKGFLPPNGDASGTVASARDISDHLPVWTVASLPPEREGERY